jgi:hypothetical protein
VSLVVHFNASAARKALMALVWEGRAAFSECSRSAAVGLTLCTGHTTCAIRFLKLVQGQQCTNTIGMNTSFPNTQDQYHNEKAHSKHKATWDRVTLMVWSTKTGNSPLFLAYEVFVGFAEETKIEIVRQI